MAFICKNKNNCKQCIYYKKDEDDRLSCYAKQDGKNIHDIILDVCNQNIEIFENCNLMPNLDIRIWLSYIMTYGHSSQEILNFASVRGIQWDKLDCDPNDKDDHYGALVLNLTDIVNLQSEEERG